MKAQGTASNRSTDWGQHHLLCPLSSWGGNLASGLPANDVMLQWTMAQPPYGNTTTTPGLVTCTGLPWWSKAWLPAWGHGTEPHPASCPGAAMEPGVAARLLSPGRTRCSPWPQQCHC